MSSIVIGIPTTNNIPSKSLKLTFNLALSLTSFLTTLKTTLSEKLPLTLDSVQGSGR